jgi:uncharacterized protein (DUF2141 family)
LLAVDKVHDGTLWLVAGGAILRSTNSGNTWQGVTNGLPSNLDPTGVFLTAAAPDVVYATGALGVYKSTDAGASFVAMNTGLPTVGGNMVGVVHFAVSPVNANVLFLTTQQGGPFFQSLDGGATWLSGGPPQPGNGAAKILAHASNASIAYVVTGGPGVYRTTDTGSSWQSFGSGLTSAPVNDISADGLQADHLQLATVGGLMVSMDGGASWSAQGSLPPLLTVGARAPQVYVVTDTEVRRTLDGVTFSTFDPGLGTIVPDSLRTNPQLSFSADGTTVFLVANSRLFRANTAAPSSSSSSSGGGGSSSSSSPSSSSSGGVFNVTGTVSDTANGGGQIHIWVMANPTDVYPPVATGQIAVQAGMPVVNAAFGLNLPNGSYTLRAFRDVNGNQLPTFSENGNPMEPQSAGTPFTVGATAVSLGNITLTSSTLASGFTNLDAYVDNRPNFGTDACAGPVIIMAAYLSGTASEVSPIQVRAPRGAVVTLLDDGACQGSNTNPSGSYDYAAGDNARLFGLSYVTDSDAGDYFFYYRNILADVIYVYQDSLPLPLVTLDLNAHLTDPTGAAAATSLLPTFAWTAVPDAQIYQFTWRIIDEPASQVSVYPSTNSYTPDAMLMDGKAYEVTLVSFRLNPNGYAWDAYGYSETANKFVVDTTGQSSVTISGGITNTTGTTGRFYVMGSGCTRQGAGDPASCTTTPQASVMLDPGATSYSLTVLKAATGTPGSVYGWLETNGNFWARNVPQASRTVLNTTQNVTGADLVFTTPLPIPVLVSPVDGSRNTGDSPVFTWEDYGTAIPVFSFMVFAAPASSSAWPTLFWGLPSTTTSFDLAAPPAEKFDLVPLVTPGQQSLVDLSSIPDWRWGVGVIECDYQGANQAYQDCASAALLSFQLVYAQFMLSTGP